MSEQEEPPTEQPDSSDLERLDELAGLGATWAIVHLDASSVKAAADYITAFSDIVIRPQQPANVG